MVEPTDDERKEAAKWASERAAKMAYTIREQVVAENSYAYGLATNRKRAEKVER